MVANGLEVFCAQGVRERPVAVLSLKNPMKVGIGGRFQFRQCVAHASQERLGNSALDIAKILRITTELSHHQSRKEEAKQQLPTKVVPPRFVQPSTGAFGNADTE